MTDQTGWTTELRTLNGRTVWVVTDVCEHPSITNERCNDCSRELPGSCTHNSVTAVRLILTDELVAAICDDCGRQLPPEAVKTEEPEDSR